MVLYLNLFLFLEIMKITVVIEEPAASNISGDISMVVNPLDVGFSLVVVPHELPNDLL